MAELASVSFAVADNTDLGAAWTPAPFWANPLNIVSNQARYGAGLANADCGENYTDAADIANGYVECTLGTTEAGGAGEGYGVLWCFSTSGGTGYRLVANGSGWELLRWSGGSQSPLGGATSTTFAADDVLRLEFNSGAWTVKKNGSTVTSGTGTDVTPLAAAKPGVAYSSNDSATATGIKSWRYGDLSAGGQANAGKFRSLMGVG